MDKLQTIILHINNPHRKKHSNSVEFIRQAFAFYTPPQILLGRSN
jgi:hypothetical protein